MNSPLSNLAGNLRSADDTRRRGLHLILFLLFVSFAFLAAPARGNVSLLVEEPYGFFGGVNPTGHSAIYLNQVCAESPHCYAAANLANLAS